MRGRASGCCPGKRESPAHPLPASAGWAGLVDTSGTRSASRCDRARRMRAAPSRGLADELVDVLVHVRGLLQHPRACGARGHVRGTHPVDMGLGMSCRCARAADAGVAVASDDMRAVGVLAVASVRLGRGRVADGLGMWGRS